MNSLRNKVLLIGHVGADPEVMDLNGKKKVRLSLATNESYRKNNGEKVTNTQWHNVVAWNKTADIIEEFVKKGKEIAIEGRLETRSYETEDGEKRYATEVVTQEVLLLGGKAG